MEFKDYYTTLGVSKSASQNDIKRAYRKLVKQCHPDRNPGDAKAESRFKEVGEAYAVLGDADKRKKYDELGANWRLYEQAQRSGAGGPGGWPFGEHGGGWTVDFGSGRGQHVSAEEMRDLFGDDDPFSDFFKTFFSGTREPHAARAPRPRRGRDLEQQVDLTLEEAARGVTRRVAIRSRGHARSVDVRIPAGVKDGSRVRAAGEGERGSGGTTAGDLFLLVRLRPHETIERKGDDLHVHVKVPVTTAVLGGDALVPTLNGSVRLKIPAPTQAGQVFRLKEKGMPVVGGGGARGDLYATVDVDLPKRLSAEERRHYEALQQLSRAKKP